MSLRSRKDAANQSPCQNKRKIGFSSSVFKGRAFVYDDTDIFTESFFKILCHSCAGGPSWHNNNSSVALRPDPGRDVLGVLWLWVEGFAPSCPPTQYSPFFPDRNQMKWHHVAVEKFSFFQTTWICPPVCFYVIKRPPSLAVRTSHFCPLFLTRTKRTVTRGRHEQRMA